MADSQRQLLRSSVEAGNAAGCHRFSLYCKSALFDGCFSARLTRSQGGTTCATTCATCARYDVCCQVRYVIGESLRAFPTRTQNLNICKHISESTVPGFTWYLYLEPFFCSFLPTYSI